MIVKDSNLNTHLSEIKMVQLSVPDLSGVIEAVQPVRQMMQQICEAYAEPLRRTMEAFREFAEKVAEQIKAIIENLVRPLAFPFSSKPILLAYPIPSTAITERRDRYLSIETDPYGFFIIDGEKLHVLHSATSRCGRFLFSLLTRKEQLVDYKTLQTEIGAGNLSKAFKDLKYQLKNEGYNLRYELVRTRGIALVGLKKLQ